MRRHLLLHWLGLVALTQLLCAYDTGAYDTRTRVRDLWLTLPEPATLEGADAADTDPRNRRHTGMCGGGRLPGANLLLLPPYASDDWEVPHTTVAVVEALARRPLWTSHPVTRPEDFDRRDGSFAHVNPGFVRWARTTLLPGVTDTAFRKATRSRYLGCLAPAARTMWAVREDLRSAPTCKAKLLAEYRAYNQAGNHRWGEVFGLEQWSTCIEVDRFTLSYEMVGRVAAPDLEYGRFSNGAGYDRVLSWWLRRELDGSAAELELGLKALLRAYDGEWLAEHGKPGVQWDPAAVQAAYDQAVADRGSVGGLEATQAAVQRLQREAGKVERAELEKRAEAIGKACSAYYAELGPRKAKITVAMAADDEDAVLEAIREVEGWVSEQQSPDAPLGRALADAHPLAEAAQDASRKGFLTEQEAMGIIAGVAAGCGR